MITASNAYSGLSAVEVMKLFSASSGSSAKSMTSNDQAASSGASISSVNNSSNAISTILAQVQIEKAQMTVSVGGASLNAIVEAGQGYDQEDHVSVSDGLSIFSVSSGTEKADVFKLSLSLNGTSINVVMGADGAGTPQMDPNGQDVNLGTGRYQEYFFLDIQDGSSSTQKMLNVTGLSKAQATEMYNDFHNSGAGGYSEADISSWTPPNTTASV